MRRGRLWARVEALEDAARKRQEDRHGRFLASLFGWIAAAREARQTADPAKEEEAHARRLEALARAGGL